MKVTIRMAVAMTCAILAWGVVGRGVGLPADSAVAVGAEGAKEGAPKDPAPKDASKRKDANAETRKILEEMTDVELKEVPLTEAMSYLSDKHRVGIFIDSRSLTEHGATTDTPVTFNIKEKPLRLALELMLKELGLGYTIRDGLIVVATEKDARPRMETRVYLVPSGTVNDLLRVIPDTVEIESWISTRPDTIRHFRATGGQPVGERIELSDRWGGTIGIFRGALVISQSPDVHLKIERLLADLGPVMPGQDSRPLDPESPGPDGVDR